jgi:hypothetical protein
VCSLEWYVKVDSPALNPTSTYRARTFITLYKRCYSTSDPCEICELANGGTQQVFRSFLEINTVLHPDFDLSIRGQVSGNVSLILTVLYGLFPRSEPVAYLGLQWRQRVLQGARDPEPPWRQPWVQGVMAQVGRGLAAPGVGEGVVWVVRVVQVGLRLVVRVPERRREVPLCHGCRVWNRWKKKSLWAML